MKQRRWTLLIVLALVCLALPFAPRAGQAERGVGGLQFEMPDPSGEGEESDPPKDTETGAPEEKESDEPASDQTTPPAAEPTDTPASNSIWSKTPTPTKKTNNDSWSPTATPKPDIALYIGELGKTSKTPSVTRFQTVTIVSDTFDLTMKESVSIATKGITLEIKDANGKLMKTENAVCVQKGNKYRLECSLTDTGAYEAGRYTVKVQIPNGVTKKFKTFLFVFEDPELDFSVEGETKGTDGKTYWIGDGLLSLDVTYPKTSGSAYPFEYAVYAEGTKSPSWINTKYPRVPSFLIEVPQEYYNRACVIAIRYDGTDIAQHSGVFLKKAVLSLDGEFAAANCVFQGAKQARVLVSNRASGTVLLKGGAGSAKGAVGADGAAVIDVSAWNLKAGETLTASYINETTGEDGEATLSIDVAEAGQIGLSPLGGIYLDEETASFTVSGIAGLTTRAWLADEKGNQIGDAQEGAKITFRSADLEKAAKIVCEYASLQDAQTTFPVLSLSEYDGSQTKCVLLIRESLSLDQAAMNAAGGTLTGSGAVPGQIVELRRNGVLMKNATATNQGTFTFNLKDLTPDQELTAFCTDRLGRKHESGPMLVLPLQQITVRADTENTAVHFNEETNVYQLNRKELNTLTLSGTAHKNQKLAVLFNGVDLKAEVLANENGVWTYEMPLALGYGTVTIRYQAYEEADGPAGQLAYEFYTPTANEITGVPGHIYAGEDTVEAMGDPYATFTLLVDGQVTDSRTADQDGRVTLRSAAPFREGQKVIVRMKDVVGNETQIGERTVDPYEDMRVDTSGSYLTPSQDLTLNVRGTAGQTVSLYADKARKTKLGAWEIGKDYSLQFSTLKNDLGLDQDEQEITLYLVDDHSPDTEQAVTFTYDPGCALAADSSWYNMTKETAQIIGTADKGATVTLLADGQEIDRVALDARTAAFTLQLSPEDFKGDVELTIRAQDRAGNESEPLTKKIHYPKHEMWMYLILMGIGLIMFISFLLIFLSARKKSGGQESNGPALPTGTVRLPSRPRK